MMFVFLGCCFRGVVTLALSMCPQLFSCGPACVWFAGLKVCQCSVLLGSCVLNIFRMPCGAIEFTHADLSCSSRLVSHLSLRPWACMLADIADTTPALVFCAFEKSKGNRHVNRCAGLFPKHGQEDGRNVADD